MALSKPTTWLLAAAFGVAAVGGGLLAAGAAPAPGGTTQPDPGDAIVVPAEALPAVVTSAGAETSPADDASPTAEASSTEPVEITGVEHCDDLNNNLLCDDEEPAEAPTAKDAGTSVSPGEQKAATTKPTASAPKPVKVNNPPLRHDDDDDDDWDDDDDDDDDNDDDWDDDDDDDDDDD